MSFASDNWAGASDAVMAALAEANIGDAPAYGGDRWTAQAKDALCAYFEREVAVFFVTTGSAANALSLAHFYQPGSVALVHPDSHVACDEAGGPLFFSPGLMLDLVDGPAGRMRPADVSARLARYGGGNTRAGRPTTLSFANVNELGQTYAPSAVAALAGAAKAHGVAVHLDGARFFNALAFTGASPADLTWRAGVDVMSLGFTKTGAWCAELVVFFDPTVADDFAYRHQQSGQVLSKNRFVAAQVCALLKGDHARNLAAHANARAAELADVLTRSGRATLLYPCQSNELFAFVSERALSRLNAAGAIAGAWIQRSQCAPAPPHPGWQTYRFVTNHRTSLADIARAANALGAP